MLSKIIYLLILMLFVFKTSYAKEVLKPILIEENSPLTEYETKKVENLDKDAFKNPTNKSLSELIENQVGVNSQTYCSNCGAKRLTINGLKAEHTSILIDGLPMHSAVSSFYGVDAIPSMGLQAVEVMRGAGASMTNPEAIGGTLNLITVDPLNTDNQISVSHTTNDSLEKSQHNHNFMLSYPFESKKIGWVVGGQISKQKSWDEDHNGIAESPERENISLMSKARFLIGKNHEWTLRGAYSDLNILGGAHNANKPSRVRPSPASPSDFEDEGNVESDYIGDPLKITDWIAIKRYEAQAKWKYHRPKGASFNVNAGFARQEQRSIYQHGFDYANNDHMFVADAFYQKPLANHILKAGVFAKDQRLRSTSQKLFVTNGLTSDSFNHRSLAAYLQDTFIASDSLEFDLALRGDYLTVKWLDLDQDIKEFVLAPRLLIKHSFNEHLTQRFSYGLGYRSPLTYFESQHGNTELGFEVDIEKLEKSHSFVYSLSQNTPDYYITGSGHYTLLQNMAYGFEAPGAEVKYRNTDEDYNIGALDILVGYKLSDRIMLEASAEEFLYEDGYTQKLPTAVIERRLQLKLSYQNEKWTSNINLRWIDERDLKRYGSYSDHYTNYEAFPPNAFNLKGQRAPDYFVLDAFASYNISKHFTLTAGVNNLFDFTQADYGDNPSTWHLHFNHAHYDGLHTWGPNRGREWYLKISSTF